MSGGPSNREKPKMSKFRDFRFFGHPLSAKNGKSPKFGTKSGRIFGLFLGEKKSGNFKRGGHGGLKTRFSPFLKCDICAFTTPTIAF